MHAAHPREIFVGHAGEGQRLDVYLAQELGIGRRAAHRLLARVRLNGRRATKSVRLSDGDRIEIAEASSAAGTVVVHRTTKSVLILNKPAGLPSIALAGKAGDSLAERLQQLEPERALPGPALEAGLVQRLDTGTSGLLLAARNARAWQELRDEIAAQRCHKTYLCLVEGSLSETQTVRAPIGQHPKSRRRMSVRPRETTSGPYRAQPASSHVAAIRALPGRTLVRVTTATGVRHQVRVHLASLGHPVCGDGLYGTGDLDRYAGHLLHAESIQWTDPDDGVGQVDRVDPPRWWEEVLGVPLEDCLRPEPGRNA